MKQHSLYLINEVSYVSSEAYSHIGYGYGMIMIAIGWQPEELPVVWAGPEALASRLQVDHVYRTIVLLLLRCSSTALICLCLLL
jgi:hypothetical protein